MKSSKKEIHSKSEMKMSKKQLKKNNYEPKRSHSFISAEKENSTEEDEEEYPIEKIITRRFEKKTKKIEYFVKWQGYDYTENTWEFLQSLIEDNCFEKIYDYENLSLDDKIALLKEYKKSKILKGVTEESIKITENCDEMKFFRDNYQDFNPLLKEKLDKWEYGNLNDDLIDKIIPYERTKKEGIIYKCFWKTRENEKKPRKARYYPYIVVKSVDKENFHKAFGYFNK